MKDEELKNIWRNPRIKVSDEQITDSLKSVLNRIELYELITARKRTPQWHTRILKIAGILLLPILTYLITTHMNQPDDKRLIASNIRTTKYMSLSVENKTVTLSDGTQVTLNWDAVLEAPDSFVNDTREVYLEGEAYFKISKDATRPFIVNTSFSKIQALGTEFAVIADTEYTRTTLTEGKVRVSIPHNPEIKPIELAPSEQSFYDPSMGIITVATVNTEVYTSWTKGDLIFDNTPLREVLNRLERQFNYTIVYDNPDLSDTRITAKFVHKESLSDVLNTLQKVSKFSYRRDKNIFYINPLIKK